MRSDSERGLLEASCQNDGSSTQLGKGYKTYWQNIVTDYKYSCEPLYLKYSLHTNKRHNILGIIKKGGLK